MLGSNTMGKKDRSKLRIYSIFFSLIHKLREMCSTKYKVHNVSYIRYITKHMIFHAKTKKKHFLFHTVEFDNGTS